MLKLSLVRCVRILVVLLGILHIYLVSLLRILSRFYLFI